MNIAHFQLSSPTALAPMAGLSDNPMRRLCRQFGCGLTVGEMISGDPALRHTRKTRNRIDFQAKETRLWYKLWALNLNKWHNRLCIIKA